VSFDRVLCEVENLFESAQLLLNSVGCKSYFHRVSNLCRLSGSGRQSILRRSWGTYGTQTKTIWLLPSPSDWTVPQRISRGWTIVIYGSNLAFTSTMWLTWLRTTLSTYHCHNKLDCRYYFHRGSLTDLTAEHVYPVGTRNPVTRSEFHPIQYVKHSAWTWHVSVLRVSYPPRSSPHRVRYPGWDTSLCGVLRVWGTRPARVARHLNDEPNTGPQGGGKISSRWSLASIQKQPSY